MPNTSQALFSVVFVCALAACSSSGGAGNDSGGASTGGSTTLGASGTTASGVGGALAGGDGGLLSGNGGLGGMGTADLGGTSAGGMGTGNVGGTSADGGGAALGGTSAGQGGIGGTFAGGASGMGGADPNEVPGTMAIFDGKTLSGWQQSTAMLWSVANGVLDGKGTTGGQLLMTQADYGDFRIVVSSNLAAAGGTGHLGVCFWGGRTPTGGYNKCKLIIPPSGPGSAVNTWDYALNGGLKGVTNIAKPVANAGWNTTEILCFIAKGFCRVAVNGTSALTYQEPKLASIMKGPIGLQIHNGKNEEVQYKDVFLDPAPTVDMLLTVK